MKQILIVAVIFLLIANPVYAKGFSGGGRSFSSGSKSFATNKSGGAKTSGSSTKSSVSSKNINNKGVSTVNRTYVYHSYSPVGYGGWNPISSDFWFWMWMFNRPQQVIQQPTNQTQQTAKQENKPFCDKQWWQLWRMFENC